MKFRKKQEPTLQRNPQIVRQNQNTFHYSSNRIQTERTTNRNEVATDKPSKVRKTYNTAFIISTIGLLIASVYIAALLNKPQIVLTNGQQPYHSVETYSKTATEASGSIFSFTKLTLNRQKIASEIQSKYPEITNIDVSTPLFGQSAVIKLSMASPTAIVTTNQSEYLVDSRGVALIDLSKTDVKLASDDLIRITDQTDTKISLGKPALTSDQVKFAVELKRQAEAKQLTIASINLVAGGGELQVRHSELPYYVKYSIYEDARKSFGTFNATREYLARTKGPISEYIDVRVVERAYVK